MTGPDKPLRHEDQRAEAPPEGYRIERCFDQGRDRWLFVDSDLRADTMVWPSPSEAIQAAWDHRAQASLDHADTERGYVNGACPPVVLEHFDRDTGEIVTVSVDSREHRRAVDGQESVRPRLPVVIIESPYMGNLARNTAYARAAMADCLQRGEAPFASHLLYTQVGVLDDSDPVERKRGMEAGWEFMRDADYVAVYEDLGISGGMRLGLDEAVRLGVQVVFRSLPGWKESGRATIRNAMARLGEIEPFPTYEERWSWLRRAVRVWLGVEEEWIERHNADAVAFYAAQKTGAES